MAIAMALGCLDVFLAMERYRVDKVQCQSDPATRYSLTGPPRARPKLNRGDYLRLATSRSSSSAAYLHIGHVGILAYLVDRPKPPLHRKPDRHSSAPLDQA